MNTETTPIRRIRPNLIVRGVTYISLEEAARRIGIKTRTLYDWNSSGRGPTPFKYPTGVYYDQREVEQFMAAHLQPTGASR